jgi:hypothetical protein
VAKPGPAAVTAVLPSGLTAPTVALTGVAFLPDAKMLSNSPFSWMARRKL